MQVASPDFGELWGCHHERWGMGKIFADKQTISWDKFSMGQIVLNHGIWEQPVEIGSLLGTFRHYICIYFFPLLAH